MVVFDFFSISNILTSCILVILPFAYLVIAELFHQMLYEFRAAPFPILDHMLKIFIRNC